MAERWVRVVVCSYSSELEHALTTVIDEEERRGGEVVDIKLTLIPPTSTTLGEYTALVILRATGTGEGR